MCYIIALKYLVNPWIKELGRWLAFFSYKDLFFFSFFLETEFPSVAPTRVE